VSARPPAEAPAYVPPYPFAPLGVRCLAGLVDLALTLAVVVPLGLVLSGTGVVAGVLAVIALFAWLEARYGRTPGKALLHLRVLQLDGSPATPLAAVVRNAFRVIDGFPGIYLVAITSIAGSRRRQRIGDQAAGTSVFRDPAIAPAAGEDASQ
jgi:uncharacterized RDD family membrane protein YckC